MLPSELQIFSADAAKLRDIEASASSGRVRSKAQVLGLDMMVGLWVILVRLGVERGLAQPKSPRRMSAHHLVELSTAHQVSSEPVVIARPKLRLGIPSGLAAEVLAAGGLTRLAMPDSSS